MPYSHSFPLSPHQLSNCSAYHDQDHKTVFTNLTFSSPVTSQSVDITLNDDEIDENNEHFFGTLLPSTNPRVLLDLKVADILIRDNAGKWTLYDSYCHTV